MDLSDYHVADSADGHRWWASSRAGVAITITFLDAYHSTSSFDAGLYRATHFVMIRKCRPPQSSCQGTYQTLPRGHLMPRWGRG